MSRAASCLRLGMLLSLSLLPSAVSAGEAQDIVFLGDTRPVLIRLHLRIDGKAYQQVYKDAWDDYLKHLFRHLDHKGKGYLTEQEASLLPPPGQRSGNGAGTNSPVHLAFNFRVVDANGDGKVTYDELADYYRQYGGALLVHFAQGRSPVSSEVGEALFTRLDKNKDGKLSKEELAAAADVLAELDQDGDELLSPQEFVPQLAAGNVLPPPVRRPGARGSPSATAPFVVLSADDEPAELARRILAHYGLRGGSEGKKLSQAEIGLDQVTFDRLDTNKDGKLDAAELAKFAERPADVDLLVQLGKTAAGAAPLEIYHPDGRAGPLAAAVRRTSEGTLLLTLDKAQIELRHNPGRPTQVQGSRLRYVQQFRAADTTSKGFLTLKDAQRSSFFPLLFPLLDRDGDGKLTEKELLAYLDDVQERQARAITSVPALLISDEGHGLFDLLDRNRDQRLGLRELRAAPRLLSQLNRAKEGALAREDIPRSYQLAVGLYEASFQRTGGLGVFSPAGMPLLALDWSRPGVIWFTKMDRNRDGDVSPREFLGTPEDFRRIDTDGDGLISLEEAEAAEALFRKKK